MVGVDFQSRTKYVSRSPALEAAEWFAVACELDAENRQLRRWMTNMLIRCAVRDELLELGREEIAKRWPEAGVEGAR